MLDGKLMSFPFFAKIRLAHKYGDHVWLRDFGDMKAAAPIDPLQCKGLHGRTHCMGTFAQFTSI